MTTYRLVHDISVRNHTKHLWTSITKLAFDNVVLYRDVMHFNGLLRQKVKFTWQPYVYFEMGIHQENCLILTYIIQ